MVIIGRCAYCLLLWGKEALHAMGFSKEATVVVIDLTLVVDSSHLLERVETVY